MKLKPRPTLHGGRRLSAGLVPGMAVALVAAIASCSTVNPSLVGSVGVNACDTVDTLPGNVVVVFMNRTTFDARLNFDTLETEGVTNLNQIETGATDFIASAFTCDLLSVTITGVDVRVADDFEPVDMEQVQLIGVVDFRNLKCGSVISVVLEGTPGDFDVNTQIF